LRDAAGSAGSASPSAGRRASRGGLRRGDFEAAYREGRRRAGRQFVVFARANGLGQSRFGISVKRALGTAVVRNRIRRRVREILRLHRGEIPPGWDVVVHPRGGVARAEFRALEAELMSLVREAARGTKSES
jgi:ribonuclease P protein component